jgi:DNA-binding MarR family transcriptional regulator
MTDHLALFDDLVRVETRMWNALDDALKNDHGLSLGWFFALRRLHANPDSRVLDLADDIGISPGGASKLVDRLVAAGLVARGADENDRRASRLSLTPAGRRATRAASVTSEKWLSRWFEEALGDAAPAELASLVAALRTRGQISGGVR